MAHPVRMKSATSTARGALNFFIIGLLYPTFYYILIVVSVLFGTKRVEVIFRGKVDNGVKIGGYE